MAINQLLVRPPNPAPIPPLKKRLGDQMNRSHVTMRTSAGSSPDIRSKDGMAVGHCSCIGPSPWTRLLSVGMPSHGRRRDAVVDAETCDKVGKISHLSHNTRMSGLAVRYCSENSIFSNGKVSLWMFVSKRRVKLRTRRRREEIGPWIRGSLSPLQYDRPKHVRRGIRRPWPSSGAERKYQ